MGQFIKQIFASLIGTLAGLILFFVLGTGGLVVLIVSSAMQDSSPTVKDKSILVFDLSTKIRDTKPPSTLSSALSEEPIKVMTLHQVLDALEAASKDERIMAIFLDGRGVEGGNGYANLTEVRTALERFRATGKKVIAYDVNLSEKEYYLASVANSVIINPMGMVEINGFGSQSLFFTGVLEKYGIGVQVVRVGNYKAAVEPFIRQNISPESRQQTQAFLGDVWNHFLAKVSEPRKVNHREIQGIADNQGILMASEAMAAKLVDRVAYFDEVTADLQKLTGKTEGGQSFRQISLENYAEVAINSKTNKLSSNKIAVVYAEGEIVNGEGTVNNIGSESFSRELRKIREDEDIKAVVLRVNSPGGSATASEIILRELQLINEKKPLIVSMGNVAASGGYWIATGSEEIFAEPNTLTGSIGVFGLLFNIEKIANNNGLTWDVVKTARLADLDSSVRPKTEQELAIYQKSVEQVYSLFMEKVAKSRNLPLEKVREIAQGRIWSGEDARQIGLVDQIGGLDAAIRHAADKAELGKDWKIEEYPSRKTFEAELIERLLNSHVQELKTTPDPLTKELLKLREELTVLENFNDPQGVYAYLPFNWQFK
jgi:protease-4